MKQETLEEAAEKYYESNIDQSNIPREHYEREIQDFMCGFANQWQAERSYSDEDLKQAFQDGQENMDYSEMYGWSSKLTEQDWFNQFKKKP